MESRTTINELWLPERFLSNHLKTNRLARLFTTFTRVMLALAFLPSGLTKLLGNRFTTLGIDTSVGFFFEALYRTGFYWNFIGLMQLTAAFLLIIPRTATLGAVVYFPIILNICLIIHSMHFQGTWVITTAMLLGSIYLLCWDYPKLKHILSK